MEKKTETKLQTRFPVVEKTRRDGKARRAAHMTDETGAAFIIPPPSF